MDTVLFSTKTLKSFKGCTMAYWKTYAWLKWYLVKETVHV